MFFMIYFSKDVSNFVKENKRANKLCYFNFTVYVLLNSIDKDFLIFDITTNNDYFFLGGKITILSI